MKKTESATPPPETVIERKPYNPPRIEESGQFEHLVLTCGMIPMAGGPCKGTGAKSAS